MTIDLGDYINGIPMGAMAPGSSGGGGGGGTPYVLPPATTTTLGGIIVGDNLTIDATGKLNAQASGGGVTDPLDGGNASSTSATEVINSISSDTAIADIIAYQTLQEEVTITTPEVSG